MYYILCRCWGGVTGSREGYLKEDGEHKIFATKEEAEKEAQGLNERMNTGYGPARFQYSVIKKG